MAKLLTDVGVDSVQTCMAKTTCKIVYRGLNNQGPPALNNMFREYIPARELRSGASHQIEVDRCNIQFGMKNIAVRGAQYWNMLPVEIKTCTSIDNLKSALKQYTGFDYCVYLETMQTAFC